MFNDQSSENLKQRLNNKLKNNFTTEFQPNCILTCPTDIGVQLNGGRLGSRYAPKCILNKLGNFTSNNKNKIYIQEIVSSTQLSTFEELQINQFKQIKSSIKSDPNKIIQIGGGHDNIYPLLKWLDHTGYKEITVINIDAHCDTRQDRVNHSGTPFRQFAREYKGKLKVIQYGINSYANDNQTLDQLENDQEMQIIPIETVKTAKETQGVPGLLNLIRMSLRKTESELIVLSLDLDAIDSSNFEAVSAVNPYGMLKEDVVNIIHWYTQEAVSKIKVIGLYEYNPIYDNLSGSGALFTAKLVEQFLRE